MKRYIRTSRGANLNLENNALFANVGDKIYDKSKDRVGDVVKTGNSGNYGLVYVDFHDGSKLLKINPMDDAQRRGRFYRVADSCTSKVTASYDDLAAIEYRLYECDEDGDEIDCIQVFDDEDEAIRYCSDYAPNAHVVALYGDYSTELIYSNFDEDY